MPLNFWVEYPKGEDGLPNGEDGEIKEEEDRFEEGSELAPLS